MDQNHVEKQRARAHAIKGVTYDPRIDRFFAMIMIDGQRQYLGSYVEAEEAGRAYEAAREGRPRRVRSTAADSFKSVYAEFESHAPKIQVGTYRHLKPGLIFTAPDGQRYCLRRTDFIRSGKRRLAINVWASRCRICGEVFEGTTRANAQTVTGMLRTCETHRKQQFDKSKLWPDPEFWGVGQKMKPQNKIEESDGGYESLEDLLASLTTAERAAIELKVDEFVQTRKAQDLIVTEGAKGVIREEECLRIKAARNKNADNSDLV